MRVCVHQCRQAQSTNPKYQQVVVCVYVCSFFFYFQCNCWAEKGCQKQTTDEGLENDTNCSTRFH